VATDEYEPTAEQIQAAVAAIQAARPDYSVPTDGLYRVTEPIAAMVLGVSPRTLRQWRDAGTAPRHQRIRRVTYSIRDLLRFIALQSVDPWKSLAGSGS
jgi:hypothetical protein